MISKGGSCESNRAGWKFQIAEIGPVGLDFGAHGGHRFPYVLLGPG